MMTLVFLDDAYLTFFCVTISTVYSKKITVNKNIIVKLKNCLIVAKKNTSLNKLYQKLKRTVNDRLSEKSLADSEWNGAVTFSDHDLHETRILILIRIHDAQTANDLSVEDARLYVLQRRGTTWNRQIRPAEPMASRQFCERRPRWRQRVWASWDAVCDQRVICGGTKGNYALRQAFQRQCCWGIGGH